MAIRIVRNIAGQLTLALLYADFLIAKDEEIRIIDDTFSSTFEPSQADLIIFQSKKKGLCFYGFLVQ
jgi:hypothetical protein